MVILLEALNAIRDFVDESIDKGQLGTDGTSAAQSDTGLVSADATTLLILDSTTVTDRQLKFEYVLPSTGGTSTTYREFELQDSVNSVNFDRIIFTGIGFTSGGTEDINISKRYFFKQV